MIGGVHCEARPAEVGILVLLPREENCTEPLGSVRRDEAKADVPVGPANLDLEVVGDESAARGPCRLAEHLPSIFEPERRDQELAAPDEAEMPDATLRCHQDGIRLDKQFNAHEFRIVIAVPRWLLCTPSAKQ